MSKEIIRRIDDLGRIVIPRVIREEMGFKPGEAFKITVDDQGRVILEKCTEEE